MFPSDHKATVDSLAEWLYDIAELEFHDDTTYIKQEEEQLDSNVGAAGGGGGGGGGREKAGDDDEDYDKAEDDESDKDDETEEVKAKQENHNPADEETSTTSSSPNTNPRRPCTTPSSPNRYHRLRCTHIIRTTRLLCGSNCLAWNPPAPRNPFLCPVCHAAALHTAYRNDVIALAAQYPQWGAQELRARHEGIWAAKMRRWDDTRWAGMRACEQVGLGARLGLRKGETRPPYGVRRYGIGRVKKGWMVEGRRMGARMEMGLVEGVEAEPGLVYESIERDP